MAGGGRKCLLVVVMVAAFGLLLAVTLGSAERIFLDGDNAKSETEKIVDPVEGNTLKYHVLKAGNFLWQSNKTEYHRVWPAMKFGWRIVLGTIVGFFGAAVGSVGGVGGGGIFVPMLTLIIGFDAKSSTAISKCMIMGAAGSTVYYNLKLKHPTLDLPIIDYDLAMLFQPMLMLGISIGVAFNVIFADWMVTILLIILFLGTSTKAFLKGVETWKQETILKKVLDFFYNILFKVRTKRDLNLVTGVTLGSLILGAFNPCCKDLIDYIGPNQEAERVRVENVTADVEPEEHQEVDFKPLPSEPVPNEESNGNNEGSSNVRLPRDVTNTIWINVRWKELGILVSVWIAFLVLQIFKTKSTTCSVEYWVLNLLQIPVAMSVSLYEAVGLYRGTKSVASKGEAGINWKISQLLLYFFCGILAGVVGGLLGLGGGFILGPLLLELGVPPQVSSATATFVMTFSSSMSVVEYYFLKRFPVPYAAYLFGVCVIAAFMGQHVIRRLVILLGRASLIIFILAFVIFLSALTLGGVGIVKMINEIENGDYMGFESLCSYTA